jgi:hypothetical protein
MRKTLIIVGIFILVGIASGYINSYITKNCFLGMNCKVYDTSDPNQKYVCFSGDCTPVSKGTDTTPRYEFQTSE